MHDHNNVSLWMRREDAVARGLVQYTSDLRKAP